MHAALTLPRIAAVTALLLLPVACALLVPGRDDGGPQGWSSHRGAVVPHDSFPDDCSLCHLEGGWHRIRADFQFDHDKETGVPLLGAHAHAECLRCHNDRGPVAEYAGRGCAGCHVDVHQTRLGPRCEDCHQQTSWQPSGMIAKHFQTRFPLVGAHATVACFRCHPGAEVGNFQRADTRCESCHLQDALKAKAFDHVSQGLVADCQRCHVPVAWTGASFVHPWPLTGAHATADCAECHTMASQGVFTGLSRQCESCHLQEALTAPFPDHNGLGLTSRCDQCHNTSAWKPANFAHMFPLRGAHNVSCTICHDSGTSTSYTCLVCHEHSQSKMNSEHQGVKGYVYSSPACVMCHPNGKH